MKKGIFVTATDTGVGKTYVAAGIAEALRRRLLDVGVMKPAESGCLKRADKLVPQDALRLIKAADVHDELDLVNPYRFSKPLAPYVAAGYEQKKIAFNKIMKAYRALSRRHDFMIIEGAGGILVPLTQKITYLDLAQAMQLPVLIVARPGLGTINHTLLTVSALRARRIPVAGIVINYAYGRKRGLAEKTSPVIIEKMSGVKILATLPNRTRNFSKLAYLLK